MRRTNFDLLHAAEFRAYETNRARLLIGMQTTPMNNTQLKYLPNFNEYFDYFHTKTANKLSHFIW